MGVRMVTSKVVMFTIQGLLNDGEDFVCIPKGEPISIASDVSTIYPIDEECTSKFEKYCTDLKNMLPISTISSEINKSQANL
uniref:PEPCK_N domain-containing protein n=1 Tax=Strongyloides venezuelensis TaxID=75913 RepID=A0A0K0G5F7_STRVS